MSSSSTSRRLVRAGSRAVVLLLALALVSPAGPALASTTSAAPTATTTPQATPTKATAVARTTAAARSASSATATEALPFDLPATSVLRSSSRKAFAHYIPSFPLSFDNAPDDRDYYAQHYLNPNGESGKHAAYGGFVRDRPAGRVATTDGQWQLHDMEAAVRNAVAAGLGGFSLDLLELGASGGRSARHSPSVYVRNIS